MNISFSSTTFLKLIVIVIGIAVFALSIIIFFLLAAVYIRVLSLFTGDDPAGFLVLNLVGILATSIIIAIVDVVQKLLKNILDVI